MSTSTEKGGRERLWLVSAGGGLWTESNFGTITNHALPKRLFVGRDRLDISDGHPYPYRQSGVFRARSCSINFVPYDADIRSGNAFVSNSYRGQFIPNVIGWTLEGYPYDTFKMISQGATGYARFKPGKPIANIGQFLIELKDIPRLPRVMSKLLSRRGWYGIQHHMRELPRMYKRLGLFREMGSEYLNVEFGWKPFLRDLQGGVTAAVGLHEALAQLARDNGRGVRRRGRISTDTSISETELLGSGHPPVYPTVPSSLFAGPWRQRELIQTGETYKFAGKFRYWIPDVGTPQWERRATYALFGLNPTPHLLWSVLPWTWLIDWVSNTGDIMSNLSENSAENLVAEYACVMGTRYERRTRYIDFGLPNGSRGSCSASVERVSKARDVATPYGFGLTWEGFNPKQLSILAALGLTRQRL